MLKKVKTAIFLTGECRTMNQAISFFQQNLLLENDHCNIHVFAVIQTNGNQEFESFLREKLQHHLKAFIIFDNTDGTWIHQRETMLSALATKEVDPMWIDYLRNSGSMIEYYQLHLAFLSMEAFEMEQNVVHDRIVRMRTDVVLKNPIKFDRAFLEDNEIRDILKKLQQEHSLPKWNCIEMVEQFMNRVFFQDRQQFRLATVASEMSQEGSPPTLQWLLAETDAENFVTNLGDYLRSGTYIVGLRVNVFFFGNRNAFERIHQLGVQYGQFRYPKDDYWFNAECQFLQICSENRVDIFHSATELEGKSLYEFDRNNYFEEDGSLKSDQEFSFFILRE